MGNLFIIGNGFDLSHGIPSQYSNFRSFIIEKYPQALALRDEVIYLDDIFDIDEREFAAEILLNAMDRASGEDWSRFEEALACINFNRKFPFANHKDDETDEEDRELMQDYLVYMSALSKYFIACSELWQDFFRLWIKNIEFQIEQHQFARKEALILLLTQPNTHFLTFNYTKTLQVLYGVKKVTHIHNRVGQKLIFGHDKDDALYMQYGKTSENEPLVSSSDLDDFIMSLRKDTVKPMKKYNHFFKSLDKTIDCVYSYGFSYGRPDSVYIKEIIKRIHPYATWHFTEFEASNSEALRIKKIKLRNYGFKGNFGLYQG